MCGFFNKADLPRSKNVTIYVKDPNDSFKGFMLQIRYDQERYDKNFKKGPIGEFTVGGQDPFKCMNCGGQCNRYC